MISLINNYASRGLAGCVLAAGIALSGAAHAQLATNNLVTASANQSLVGVVIGNGIQQSQPVVVVPAQGRPLVGIGALSGKNDHYGSGASLSVANSERLLGVEGAGGRNSPNSLSVRNPKQAPVLSAGH